MNTPPTLFHCIYRGIVPYVVITSLHLVSIILVRFAFSACFPSTARDPRDPESLQCRCAARATEIAGSARGTCTKRAASCTFRRAFSVLGLALYRPPCVEHWRGAPSCAALTIGHTADFAVDPVGWVVLSPARGAVRRTDKKFRRTSRTRYYYYYFFFIEAEVTRS